MNTGKNPFENSTSGILIKKDACIVIVKTEWNNDIVDALEKSCIEALKENNIQNIKTYIVPGAVEIPFAIKQIAAKSTQHIDAIIAFGCVIQGGTPHFEYVCNMVTNGVLHLNQQLDVPIIFGILTVNNKEQAIARIKNGSEGDKGQEAAITALKMIEFNNSNF